MLWATINGRRDPKPARTVARLEPQWGIGIPVNGLSGTSTLEVPTEVVEGVLGLRMPIIVSHVVPDADALGSMLAVGLGLSRDGCQTKVALADGSLSQRLSFMFDLADIAIADTADFDAADGFIALDTAKLGRCNVGAERKQTDWVANRPIVNIDHHATNTRFGRTNWIVSTAGSTCELAYYLLQAAKRPITPAMASLLYAGMQTDTIGFSLPTTTAPAMRACADLIDLGADVGVIGERLCRSQRTSEFDLLRIIYANTKVEEEGRLAYSSASYDEIHAAGCTAADIDEQINVPRSLQGVKLAMLFTEGRRKKVRINFRGSGEVTVVELAALFGGGGHAQAAGAILDCSLDDAMKQVIPAAATHLKRFDSG